MNSTISTIAYTVFFVLIGIMGLVSLLSVYIYIRYGRTLSITMLSSAVFILLFVIGASSALAALYNLLQAYA